MLVAVFFYILAHFLGAMFGSMYLDIEKPKWFTELPSTESRGIVYAFVILFGALVAVIGIFIGVYKATSFFRKGAKDLYRAFFPKKIELPRAEIRR